ncbi:MAG: nitrite/sulfite reductase [Blastocatellia bacterium]|nr:nitrite/sulfite reductase [Blastocatellia bacterium]
MKENKVERLKSEKDGLDVWRDIERYAQTGFDAIDPGDLDRFRWYGLYTQRPLEDKRFMLRIKVPNGVLNSDQLETIGRLSQTYAASSGDITTRQGIQFHHVRIEDVPHIVEELKKVSLTTQEACGDVVRNVVGCPLAGIDDDELIDASHLVRQVVQQFIDNRDFSNLPRKFKISITGCTHQCAQHEINDIGLVALPNEVGEVGFDLWVGGGLGARPFLSQRLGVFVYYDEAVEVLTRIVEIFRDHGNRDDRRKARLKFLVADWGVEKFRAELERRLGRRLADAPPGEPAESQRRDHIGTYRQRQDELYYIGAAVLRGRISGEQMSAVAGLARRYANGRIRLTNAQNLIVLDVPLENVVIVRDELARLGLLSDASAFRRGTISCTGRQFCKLAIVETKQRAEEIILHLEQAIPDFRDDINISVTGCVNSCAQYQIADIGLVGVKGQVNGEEVDFFQVHLGGHLGRAGAFGRKISKRVRVEETKFYLERVLRAYRAQRLEGERFHEFIARHEAKALETIDELQSIEVAVV